MSSKGNLDFMGKTHSSEKAGSVRNVEKLGKGSSVEDVESTEFVLFSRPYGSSFGRQESLMSSQSEAPSTSRIYYEEISRRRKPSGGAIAVEDSVFLTSRGSDRSRFSRLSRDSKHRTPDDSVENLVLKKTDETINFSLDDFGPDPTNNMQCPAERLRLGDDRKSSGEVTTRSDQFFSDNLLSEINADSQGEEIVSSENISQRYVPFQTYETTVRGSDAIVTKTEGEKKLQELWRRNFSLNKTQIVAFFGQKRRKKKLEKRDHLYEIRFLSPPVSWKEDYETKLHIRIFYFRLLQLIILTGVAMIMVSSSMFYLSDISSRVFLDSNYIPSADNPSSDNEMEAKYAPTLRLSRTVEDFWAYAENTLIKLLYWDFYYSKVDTTVRGEGDNRKMFSENQILGVARIRQVRVTENSCKIHPFVEKFFDDCFGPYSVFGEDTRPIRTDMADKATATAWEYTEAETLDSLFYWGEIALYGGGGYYLDLATTEEEAKKMIQELKENKWVSKATRAIFIDFNIYNANVNLFCICKIIVEIPPIGGIIPYTSFDALKLARYLTATDFFVLAFEFLYIILVIYDTWLVVKGIVKEKLAFLFFIWNYLDMLIVLLSYLYLVLSIVRYVYAAKLMAKLSDRPDNFTDFSLVKNIQIAFDDTTGIIVFCHWVRLFSYLNFTVTMMQFSQTLKKSMKDMLLFLPMFMTMLVAFSILAYILFGSKLRNYNSVRHSFMGLLQAFLGEFGYYEIAEVRSVLGPIFYIAFVFFIFFVMLNVFIAIMNDAYTTVKAQVIPQSPRTGEYIKRALVNCLTCCRVRRKVRSLSKAMRKKILFGDIQKALKRAGFKHEEIQIFFHKYDINCDNFLEDSTKGRIMKDLELKRINFSETSEQFQINHLRRRLDEYRERMDVWENKLQPVIDKVDILLQRSSAASN